jgi:signal transduction histidine kinase
VSLSKTIISSIPEGGMMVPHDPVLLKRALINLLENGIEAANSIVRVSILQIENMAMIKVCDDGPGMDEMKIPIFFQGRGQSGKANRQAFGLSSTNHIVRSHGGKLIYRKSDLGGSSFEIRLGVI